MLYGSYFLFRITFSKVDSQDISEVYNQFFSTEKFNQNKVAGNKIIINLESAPISNNLNEIKNITYSGNEAISEIKTHLESPQIHSSCDNRIRNSFSVLQAERGPRAFSFFSINNEITSKVKYELEEFYFKLIVKEKSFIVLNVIIWVYLLSFLLWIQGVRRLKPNEDALSQTELKSFFNDSNFLKLNSSRDANDLLDYDSSEAFSTIFDLKLCVVFEFARRFFQYFTTFMCFLRLFTLCINIFVSVVHHVKFRREYIESLVNMFAINSSLSFDPNKCFKQINFKQVQLIYTTKNLYKFRNSAKNDFQSKQTKCHYDHTHFLRYYVKMIFFYSMLKAPCLLNESVKIWKDFLKEIFPTRDAKNRLSTISFNESQSDFSSDEKNLNQNRTFLIESKEILEILNNFNNDQLENASDNSFFHFSEILAHSTKLIIYFIFFYHLSVFFKYKHLRK
jgi:hypothetical protein